MYSRRDLVKPALAGVQVGSVIKGVRLGAQTYSFRDLPLDGMMQAMAQVDTGDCEVLSREDLRKWQLTVQAVSRTKRAAVDFNSINLDIRHFFAAGCDSIQVTIFRPVLQLQRDTQWPIEAFIEYEYCKDALT